METQGSIAKDLYGDVLQSSSVEPGTGPVVTHIIDDSQETDLWYDDESPPEGSVGISNETADMDREWQKRHDQFHTIGYRDGLIAGKEFAAQEGFNIGHRDSINAGYRWGLVRGITRAMACLPAELKEKLIESKETRNRFQLLHESVQSVSTTDALKLFYEDQKRKSTNQGESAEPNAASSENLKHQSPNVGVLEDYYVQLKSLVIDSPLLDVHSEINQ